MAEPHHDSHVIPVASLRNPAHLQDGERAYGGNSRFKRLPRVWLPGFLYLDTAT